MRKMFVLVLAFLASFTLGVIGIIVANQCQHYAEKVLEGRPMPDISDWIFQLGGGALCLFLIPWALLLVDTLWSARSVRPAAEKDVGFILALVVFVLFEVLIATWFALACALPVISFHCRCGRPPESDVPAYITGAVLGALLLVALAFTISLLVQKRKFKRSE